MKWLLLGLPGLL